MLTEACARHGQFHSENSFPRYSHQTYPFPAAYLRGAPLIISCIHRVDTTGSGTLSKHHSHSPEQVRLLLSATSHRLTIHSGTVKILPGTTEMSGSWCMSIRPATATSLRYATMPLVSLLKHRPLPLSWYTARDDTSGNHSAMSSPLAFGGCAL